MSVFGGGGSGDRGSSRRRALVHAKTMYHGDGGGGLTSVVPALPPITTTNTNTTNTNTNTNIKAKKKQPSFENYASGTDSDNSGDGSGSDGSDSDTGTNTTATDNEAKERERQREELRQIEEANAPTNNIVKINLFDQTLVVPAEYDHHNRIHLEYILEQNNTNGNTKLLGYSSYSNQRIKSGDILREKLFLGKCMCVWVWV